MSNRTITATKKRARYGGRPVAPCGTRAAYERHMRHDETPDFACKLASARYMAERRADRKN